MRAPLVRVHEDDLIVDNFAGGGGTSLGIEWALGRSPDIAINHNAEALAMHMVNHPRTEHIHGDIWDVDPTGACRGKRVALAWFSPDCKHFSKAKGGKPVEKRIRGLAWVVIRWARAVKPRVIILENVEEFADWGPLINDRPDPARIGLTYRRWLGQLIACGYDVEARELRACDYGAPTTRKRLFVIARCDGQPIVWPEPTFAPSEYRSAAECIDWSLPCPSIFERSKPLADKTLRRIARGVCRYTLEAADPFLLSVTHRDDRVYPVVEPMRTVTGAHRGEFALAVPTLIQTSYGERPGQAPRVPGLEKPLGTVVAGGQKHALVTAFLAKHYGGHEGPGVRVDHPISTITTQDHHALVAAHLLKLYGTCQDGQPIDQPFPTVRAGGTHLAEVRTLLVRHGFLDAQRQAVVRINGLDYVVADIGMRMLQPRELFRAQSFPDSYVIDPEFEGKPLSKTSQVRMCGNSVPPIVAASIVAANLDAERVAA